MAKPITITVKARDTDGQDAPTVEDLLSQIQDSVAILRGVEKAVLEDHEEFVWRVTNIARNSPYTFEITPEVANCTVQHINAALIEKHSELGSVEGFIVSVGLDGHKRPLVWIRSRLDKQKIKCTFKGEGLQQIGTCKVSEVFEGMRVRVNGLVHYKNLRQVENIEVEDFQVFKPDSELPAKDSIVSPNFTSGVEASEYLETLRKAE